MHDFSSLYPQMKKPCHQAEVYLSLMLKIQHKLYLLLIKARSIDRGKELCALFQNRDTSHKCVQQKEFAGRTRRRGKTFKLRENIRCTAKASKIEANREKFNVKLKKI